MKATHRYSPRVYGTLSERLQAKLVLRPNGCLEFTGYRLPTGYGLLGKVCAHRVAWETVNGPIPEGMFVCHRCDNPPCCNPDHLFLGDHTANMRDMVAKGRSANQQKTHCPQGHRYDEGNTYISQGRRFCRQCHKRRSREYWQRRAT